MELRNAQASKMGQKFNYPISAMVTSRLCPYQV